MVFLNENIYNYNLPNDYFDFVLFHSSLHHFKNLNDFIPKVIRRTLTPGGKLIVNEFVGANRLQYKKHQLNHINRCILLIDREFRKLFKTNLYKDKFHGYGLLRMLISDPSECVESENILPVIRNHFKVVEEKKLGGNLLMPVLKDISHHFVELDSSKEKCLNAIFKYEDEYLQNNESDLVFGIYERKIIYE